MAWLGAGGGGWDGRGEPVDEGLGQSVGAPRVRHRVGERRPAHHSGRGGGWRRRRGYRTPPPSWPGGRCRYPARGGTRGTRCNIAGVRAPRRRRGLRRAGVAHGRL